MLKCGFLEKYELSIFDFENCIFFDVKFISADEIFVAENNKKIIK